MVASPSPLLLPSIKSLSSSSSSSSSASGPERRHASASSDPSASHTSLLTRRQVSAIVGALPIRHKLNRWRLAYSTHRDGTSLNTLYRKCARASPTVMVIRDDAGYVFGCFAPESWAGPGAGHSSHRAQSLKRYCSHPPHLPSPPCTRSLPPSPHSLTL